MNEAREVGLLGLGLMGAAMSTRLIAEGYRIYGYDPVPEAREALADRGGEAAGSPRDVGARCRLILLSLPNGHVTREVCLGPGGLIETAEEGTIVADTSTIAPDEAKEIAGGLASSAIHFFDAGLSGSSSMVGRGEAVGVIGGNEEHFPAVSKVLDKLCREVIHVGGHGDGMRAKLVINAVLTINRFAVAEGLVLSEKMGMDISRILRVLRASIAYSEAMDIWGQRMVDRDYHPPTSRVRQHNKDAQIILGLGRQFGAPTLALSQINHVVQAALANGFEDADNSSVAEMLRMLAGIPTVPWPPEDHSS